MTTLTFNNGKDVLVHYVTDIVLTTRRYKIEYENGVKKFSLFGKDDEEVVLEDNFNVYEIQDRSWKFRKVYDLDARNKIPRNGNLGRELNMIVWVGSDGKYYQLDRNPRTAWTENSDWKEYADGPAFEKSISLRPAFRQLEYTIEAFRRFAKEHNLALTMKIGYRDAGITDPNVRITQNEYDLNPDFPIVKTEFDLNLAQGKQSIGFPYSVNGLKDPITADLDKQGVINPLTQ